MGALIGALVAGKIADKIGRNKSLLLNDIVYAVGTLVCVIAPDFIVLVIGRFVVGLGVGLASLLVPLFITEISPKEIRGSIGVLNQLFITVGILAAFIVNFAFAKTPVNYNWRVMFGLAIIPSVIHFVGALVLKVESPKWLFVRGNLEGASSMLRKLRGDHNVNSELDNLALEENENNSSQSSRLCVKKNAKPLVIGILMNFIQQAVGVNAIMFEFPSPSFL